MTWVNTNSSELGAVIDVSGRCHYCEWYGGGCREGSIRCELE
jgi:hypothetical protein